MQKKFINLQKHSLLATLYLVVFLNSFGYFLIFPVLSKLIFGKDTIVPNGWEHALGAYLYPTVLAAGSLAGLVFAPIIGRWSDHAGRKKVLLICTVLTTLSFLLPIWAIGMRSIALFILSNALNGAASNNQAVAQAAISDLSLNKQKKTYRFAVDTAVICLAMSLGPLAGSYLADPHYVSWFSDKTPFVFAMFLTLIALLLLLILLPETNTLTNSKDKTYPTFASLFKTFSDIFRLPKAIWRLLFITLLLQTAWAQFYQYLYVYFLKAYHWPTEQISGYSSLLGIYLIVGLLVVFPLLLKIFKLRRIIELSTLITMLSFLGLALGQAKAQWFFALPLSISIGLYFPCVLTLLSEEAGKEYQGWIMTISGAIIGIAWLGTGFSAIWLSHFNPKLPIYLCTFMGAVAWLISFIDRKSVSR